MQRVASETECRVGCQSFSRSLGIYVFGLLGFGVCSGLAGFRRLGSDGLYGRSISTGEHANPRILSLSRRSESLGFSVSGF